MWAENVAGRRNVRAVYRATGLPDDDGYLGTQAGRQERPEGSAANLFYRLRLADPANYGVARQVRVGLKLAL